MFTSAKGPTQRSNRTSKRCLPKTLSRLEAPMDNPHRSVPVLPSEITPKSLYLSRRDFLRAAGLLGGSALLAACAPGAATPPAAEPSKVADYAGKTDELG